MSNDSIFKATNHHVESCGEPPRTSDEGGDEYRGYFENEHGEQSIFVYNRLKREGMLYLGDAGWEFERGDSDNHRPSEASCVRW